MLRSLGLAVVFACGVAVPAFAQDGSLEAFFSGKEVVAKIDMPGTQQGVDLNFDKPSVMDWNQYSQRLKNFGVAIHKGEVVRVTKFVEKKDRIEFQLAGGGFGTAGDDSNTTVSPVYVPKSDYEKDLEKQISNTTDDRRKRDLQRDLDRERARRARQDADNQNAAKVASQMKAQVVGEKRLTGGSRFNLRWQGQIPSDYRNPQGIMQVLSEYVDFGGGPAQVEGPPPPAPPMANDQGPAQVRRGMKISEVSGMFGPGKMVSDSVSNDGLRTQVMRYVTADSSLDVTYVEGVVVRYSMQSR